MKINNITKILATILITIFFYGKAYSAGKDLLKVDWSFTGITGKFERDSLQRGYQVVPFGR